MTDDVFDQVRDEDHDVLVCIRRGDSDVRSINEETALTQRQINYAFEKLQELGLIDVHRPEGYTTQVINGQKRRFRKPKQAMLTENGLEYFQHRDTAQLRYENMDKSELVRLTKENEEAINDLKKSFAAFRQQVLRKLED